MKKKQIFFSHNITMIKTKYVVIDFSFQFPLKVMETIS